MSSREASVRALSRITCSVHRQESLRIVECLRSLGIGSVILESGRSVRRRFHRSRFGFTRRIVRTEDSPIEIYRFDVDRSLAAAVVHSLVESADMDAPGRGTIYSQHVDEYLPHPTPGFDGAEIRANRASPVLRDLALMTCILSASGSGERLAELALELGTGVPIVTLGTGTGMRDRLGLLRITVPPEKELVHLLVPALDAEGLVRQLIEKGRLNGPGRGFISCTVVHEGLLDTRLQIGPQEHAASMEQVIAAIDKLYAGTAWRRRFAALESSSDYRLLRNHVEIALVCAEERSGIYVDAALTSGARGGTSSRVRRLRLDEAAAGDAARERCIITVPADASARIVQAILAADDDHLGLDSLQVLSAPIAFTYQSPQAAGS